MKMTTLTTLTLIAGLAVACGKKDESSAKGDESAKPATPTDTKPAPAKPTDDAKPAPTAEPAAPVKVAKAKRLEGTSDAKVMCGDDSLLLTKFSFEKLAGGTYCDECKTFDEEACGLDWPSSDVMECDEYDTMRNGIYAAYGNTFAKKKWQDLFAKKPWYKATGKVDELALPVVAQKNIKHLKDAAATCRKSAGKAR